MMEDTISRCREYVCPYEISVDILTKKERSQSGRSRKFFPYTAYCCKGQIEAQPPSQILQGDMCLVVVS